MLEILFRVLGAIPNDEELNSYLEAYYGDRLNEDQRALIISKTHESLEEEHGKTWFDSVASFVKGLIGNDDSTMVSKSPEDVLLNEASNVASLLVKSTEEMDSVLQGLDGGFIKPAPGGGKCFVFDYVLVRSAIFSTRPFLVGGCFKICCVTVRVYYRLEETFTHLIPIECQVLVHGREVSGRQQKLSGNTERVITEDFLKPWL